MIDTIHIRVVLEFLTIQNLINLIEVTSNGNYERTGRSFIKGKFKNFIIEISGQEVTIMGSLTKYYHGNNLEFLSPQEIKAALKRLSFELGFKVELGRLSRIDIAENLFLKYPVKEYTSRFRPNSKHALIQDGYQTSRTACVYYDKVKELKKNDPVTYELLIRSNPRAKILRFELRILRRLAKIFNVRVVKVVYLYSSSFLKKLARLWLKEYRGIQKTSQPIPINVCSPKELKNALMFLGLKSLGGIDKADDILMLPRAEYDWPYSQTYKLKQLFKSLSSKEYLVKVPSHITELDRAINSSKICSLI